MSDKVKNKEVMDELQEETAETSETSETSETEETAQTVEEAGEARAGETEEEPAEEVKKDKRDEKIEDLTDRLQRSMAEFDNYRKRTEKEKASMYMVGAKEVVEKILPVVDNFERALESTTDEQKADPFVEGMEKIYKHFCKTLEDMGVTPIEAVGREFDPNLHNAVMHVEDEEAGDNIIVEEFQKGYLYKEFVVRHSMVKVAN